MLILTLFFNFCKKRKAFTAACASVAPARVDQGRIELPSKRGKEMRSTCLFPS